MHHWLPICLILATSTAAGAEPVKVDLSLEYREYSQRASNRNLGIGLLVTAGLATGATALGFRATFSARSDLLAQTLPIDIGARQSLVTQGKVGNIVGLIGAVVGLATGVGSLYFLKESFQ